MKVTIKEIAAKAGVSISAVSFALNNKPGVSQKTRELIYKTAKELGYTYTPLRSSPTVLLKGFVVKVLKIIRHGHTINASHNSFIDAYIEGLNEIAFQQGITIEVGTFPIETKIATIAEEMNKNKPNLGYLIVGTELSEDDIKILKNTDSNVVFMDTHIDYLKAHFVDMNNTDTVYRALNHLKEYGHKKIGLIKTSVSTQNFHMREKAFYKVMKDLSLPINPLYIVDVDSTYDGSYHDMLNHLNSNIELPTAFFATNDIMALGCLKAFGEKSIRVPEDLSIVGFDNLPMSEMSNPPLTTIDVYKECIALHALNILISLKGAQNGYQKSVKTLVDGTLISRSSVKRL
ncbi:MAG: LacI family DNA-binding transcriptional regulator [Sphaerochaetaceae bacterium]